MSKLFIAASEAIYLTLLLSAPPVLICTFLGLIVAVVQTMTQIQEQTVGFVFKLLSVVATLFLLGPWMGNLLSRFAMDLFLNLNKYIK